MGIRNQDSASMSGRQQFEAPSDDIRILVVEDNLVVYELLRTSLDRMGYTIVVESDFQSARKRMESDKFDLILLDLNLPDGNGLDLLDHLRKDLQSTTPVIILSAVQQEAIILRGLELGANDYITKPFSIREILLRIKKLIEK